MTSWRISSLVVLALGLVGCAEANLPKPGGLGNQAAKPAQPVAQAPVPQPTLPQVAPPVPPPDVTAAPSTAKFDPKAPIPIALLVPLTGPQAELGQAMVQAASLALFDFADPRLQLMPRDVGESETQGREAATAAIQAGARLILGPVFARAVTGAAEAAAEAHVPLIAFSSDRAVARPGAWILGFAPEEDVRRMVSYMAKQGAKQFAGLTPHSAYGQRVATAFNQAVASQGGEVVAQASFAENANALGEPMRQVAAAQGRPQGALSGSDTWTPRYQSILLAEGGPLLTALAALLPYYQVDTPRVRVIGTGLWDDPRITREPNLAGGWFPAADPGERKDFVERYTRLYGKPPVKVASLAFDAVALAATLAQAEADDVYALDRLTQVQGFKGVDGLFRLRADGTTERGLAVLEVQRDGFHVIDPAPQSFEAPPSL